MSNNNQTVTLRNGTQVLWEEFSKWGVSKQNFNIYNPRDCATEEVRQGMAAQVKKRNSERNNSTTPLINNNQNRNVMTPKGKCESIKEAAWLYGVNGATIRDWIKKEKEGFLFLSPPLVKKRPIKAGGISGSRNPSSKAVITPDGEFQTLKAAAKHYGVGYQVIVKWVTKSKPTQFKFSIASDVNKLKKGSKGRAVLTPKGMFFGINAAAEKFGITHSSMRHRILSNNWIDFRYAD